VVMVVKEPGVEVGVMERGLNCGDVHGADSIASGSGLPSLRPIDS
jgi:hypothetical protein